MPLRRNWCILMEQRENTRDTSNGVSSREKYDWKESKFRHMEFALKCMSKVMLIRYAEIIIKEYIHLDMRI